MTILQSWNHDLPGDPDLQKDPCSLRSEVRSARRGTGRVICGASGIRILYHLPHHPCMIDSFPTHQPGRIQDGHVEVPESRYRSLPFERTIVRQPVALACQPATPVLSRDRWPARRDRGGQFQMNRRECVERLWITSVCPWTADACITGASPAHRQACLPIASRRS